MERFAPSRLAEAWDNVGLLLGDPDAPVGRIMTCLTVTRTTAEEAVAERAELVVSHHPVLFRAAKRIRADLPESAPIWMLVRAGIAVVSPHTAFDSTSGGINDGLCRKLGLSEVRPLRPIPTPASCKVVVFTPDSDREAVLAAAFWAGAGVIGDYRECSFGIPGQGTFFGSAETKPSVGQRGRRESVEELRLEMICPKPVLEPVLAAVRAAHSYEEPAIDVYPLEPEPGRTPAGAGRIGRLQEPRSLEDFARFVSRSLGHVPVQAVGHSHKQIRRVAIACGAGDDFVADAARSGADVLLTGEARFHRALEAESLEIGLVLAGHYATERPAVEELAERIGLAFPGLTVWSSRQERDPIRLVRSDETPRPD